jgi:glycosyltransferase involved in cell wall biosynthesis
VALTHLKQQPEVSVVIPVYNGADTIAQTIECILKQSYLPAEIVVVNDGSTDRTAEVLNKFDQQIISVTKPNGGPASARNCGVEQAKGKLIAFTDSDCLPDKEWLAYLIAGFSDDSIAGVGGRIESAGKTVLGEYIDFVGFLNPQPDAQGEIPYLITANACFRRDALLQAGSFSERFRKPGGEEPELCWRVRRLGYRFGSAADALVLHHHRQTVRSFIKTLLNYGEGTYILGQAVPDYYIQSPGRVLLRKMLSLRSVFRRIGANKGKIGLKRAITFSLLDYVRELAFSLGYFRGAYRGA